MQEVIHYFSGTGNSLFVAKAIQHRLSEAELIPILGLNPAEPIRIHTASVGLVFPQYGGTMPKVVSSFLKRCDFSEVQYIFVVVTRGGTECKVLREINDIVAPQGKQIDALFVVDMPSGSQPLVSTYAERINPQRVDQLDRAFTERLPEIIQLIQKRAAYIDDRLQGEIRVPPDYIKPIMPLITHFEPALQRLAKQVESNFSFYTDEKCNICGVCETLCLAGKIQIANNKPVWRKEITCLGCLACLNYCPEQAIQVKSRWYLKSHTPENGRYHHEGISVLDIAGQKMKG